MKRFASAFSVAALLITAAGCSSGSTHRAATPTTQGDARAATTVSGGEQRVTIHTSDAFRFSPATIIAHPGAVRVTLVNDGSYPHNLTVPALHATSHTVTGELGDTRTSLTLNFPRPGTYQFDCMFHSSAGMRGQFIVR